MSFIAIFISLLVAFIVLKLVFKFLKMVVLAALMTAIGCGAVLYMDDIKQASQFPADIQMQLEELF